jgi:hypothetical protein
VVEREGKLEERERWSRIRSDLSGRRRRRRAERGERAAKLDFLEEGLPRTDSESAWLLSGFHSDAISFAKGKDREGKKTS